MVQTIQGERIHLACTRRFSGVLEDHLNSEVFSTRISGATGQGALRHESVPPCLCATTLPLLQEALEVCGFLGISKPDRKNETPRLLVRVGLHIILEEGSILGNQDRGPRGRRLLRNRLFLGGRGEVDRNR